MSPVKKDRTGQRLVLVLLLLAIAGLAIWACVPKSKVSKNSNFVLKSDLGALETDYDLVGDAGADNAFAAASGALPNEAYEEDYELCETIPSTQVYFNTPDIPSGIGMGEGIYVNQRRTPVGSIPY